MSNVIGKLTGNRDVKVFSGEIAEVLGGIEQALIVNFLAFVTGKLHKHKHRRVDGFYYFLGGKEKLLSRFPIVGKFSEAYDDLIETEIIRELEVPIGNKTAVGIALVDDVMLTEYNLYNIYNEED